MSYPPSFFFKVREIDPDSLSARAFTSSLRSISACSGLQLTTPAFSLHPPSLFFKVDETGPDPSVRAFTLALRSLRGCFGLQPVELAFFLFLLCRSRRFSSFLVSKVDESGPDLKSVRAFTLGPWSLSGYFGLQLVDLAFFSWCCRLFNLESALLAVSEGPNFVVCVIFVVFLCVSDCAA